MKNVRFFFGTKERYLSLYPHNSKALYFCADTSELFWGDLPLSGGSRLVLSKDQLPTPELTAEGVVYYTVDTHDGYLFDRASGEWLLVVNGSAQAPIVDLKEYYTKEEVETLVEEAITALTTANDFITSEELTEKGYATEAYVLEKILEVNLGHNCEHGPAVDLSGYATRDELAEAIAAIVHPTVDLTDYATKEFVEEAVGAIEHPTVDLTDYVKREELDNFIVEIPEQYITEEELEAKGYLTEVPEVDLTGIATEEYVNKKILEAELADKEADLEAYYTKSEVDALIPEVPVNVSAFENDANYIIKLELGDLPTEPGVVEDSNLIKCLELALSKAAIVIHAGSDGILTHSTDGDTGVHLEGKHDLTGATYLDANGEIESRKIYLAWPVWDFRYNKAEDKWHLDHCAGDFSNSWSIPVKTSDLRNDSGYITASDIPDTSNFITMEDVEAKGYLTEHQSLEGYARVEDIPTDYLTEADLEGYSKFSGSYDDLTDKPEIPEIPENISAFNNDIGYLTEHQDLSDYALKSELPSTEGLATESYVLAEIAKAQLEESEVDLSSYATKDELREAIESIEHPTTDFTGYATEDFVNEAIAGIEIPEVDLSEYAKTKTVVTQKYEVLPVDGLLISYRGDEVRLNTQRVTPVKQNVGAGGNPNTFNVTFRAYAPEEATKVIKGVIDGNTGAIEKDSEAVALATDAYGRKYATMWAATAMYTGSSWLDYGSLSTVEKYLGHRYVFEWYNEDKLIGSDRFNIVLTNDNCHNDAVPAEVIKRINDKIKAIEIPEIPEADLTGYATEEFVNKAIAAINIPEIDLSEYAKLSDIPSHDELATKEALRTVETAVEALALTTAKERYEVIRVPGLEVMRRDDEIRLNTEHVELSSQNVGEGGEANAYYVGIKIYAPATAESVRQNITSAPGIQEDKEILPFTATDIDSYGRKYSTIWVKCAIYQNGAWLNYGMNSTSAKCLGYYYTVEWYDINGNIVENDSIHVVFTNDACHYSNISDAVSRRLATVEESIATITVPEIPKNVSAFINDAGYLTEHQDLSSYALKAELPSIEGLATEDYVLAEIAKAQLNEGEVDLSGYATKDDLKDLADTAYVDEKIATIELPEAEIFKVDFNAPNFAEATEAYKAGKVLMLINAAPDANSYAMMNYVSDSYITFTKFLTNRSETYGAFNTYYLHADNTWEVSKEVKISKVEANIEGEIAGQLNTIKINKEIYSIPSIDGLATEEFVAAEIAKIEIPKVPSIEGLATEDFVSEAIANIEHPTVDLTGYATEAWVTEQNYLTEHQDLTEYALKSELFNKDYNELINTPEIPTIEGLASEAFVQEEIAKISIPVVDGFATKEELAAAIEAIDIPEVPTNVSAFTNDAGYLTEHQDLSEYAKLENIPDVSGFISEIPAEYITESELESKGYLTEHQSLEDYATKQFVEEAIDAIEIPEVPTNISAFTNDAGYLKEHQDLSEYAKRDELPSIEGLATEEFVAEAIAEIEFPETDLANYYTKEETDAVVAVKANDVPFTTSKIVNRAIGGFVIGEDISGLTIAELFAKLLELSDESTDPSEPEIPEEPDTPIEAAKKLAMYSVTNDLELAATSDTSVTTMTVAEAAMAPAKSGFYQIVDDSGEVIESGYQDLTITSEDTYYVIALPKVIDYNTMVTIQAYDADDDKWYPADKLPLISDPDIVAELCDEVGVAISHIDTNVYTVYVLEDICTGSQLRYIIKEA